ncbi:MAG: class I SAM-dependent methyltransferase [Polyangiales bacterium]
MTQNASANEAQRRVWNDPTFVERWKRRERGVEPLTAPLIEHLGLAPGERVIDIGCGGGNSTLAAAVAVGAKGAAVGVDLSAPLLELARERAAQAGLTQASFVVDDAQTAQIPGAPFDVAMSRLGVMFFSQPVAAFTNIRKHLRPGGRLAFLCMREGDANPSVPPLIARLFGSLASQGGGVRPPSPIALADRDYTEGILRAAGFVDIECKPGSHILREDAGTLSDERALAPFRLSPEEHAAAARELREYEAKYLVDGELRVLQGYYIFSAKNGA